jgi:hypothetical protein
VIYDSKAERFDWSINFRGASKVSIQLSTEDFYREFPSRAVPADVHGILMRVASLEDTLRGKIKHKRAPVIGLSRIKRAPKGNRRKAQSHRMHPKCPNV